MQVSSISKSETDQAAGSNSNTLTGANSAQSIPCYNLIDQTGSTDANFSSPKTKLTGDINMKNVNMVRITRDGQRCMYVVTGHG